MLTLRNVLVSALVCAAVLAAGRLAHKVTDTHAFRAKAFKRITRDLHGRSKGESGNLFSTSPRGRQSLNLKLKGGFGE